VAAPLFELVQLTRQAPSAGPGVATGVPHPIPLPVAVPRKPSWLKVKAPGGRNYVQIKGMMRELGLHTVCEEARCPNIGECWEHKAATFMILGDVCTRNCTYCAVAHGTPQPFDPVEPVRLAEAVARMELQHVVITSVDRDDLPNGGAEAFAGCITEIRRRLPDTTVEVLIPDFKGSEAALRIVMDARPDILNHNLETAERLYRLARPGGRYERALELLARARRLGGPDALTKSGIILGLGEEWDEVLTCMRDLRRSDVNILTLGQYLRPSEGHLPIARYYTPDEFAELADIGHRMGFTHVQASPLTRSSYHAWDQAKAAGAGAAPDTADGIAR
jgi:lipoic acid synthetase